MVTMPQENRIKLECCSAAVYVCMYVYVYNSMCCKQQMLVSVTTYDSVELNLFVCKLLPQLKCVQ